MKLNMSEPSRFYCPTTKDWFLTWLTVEYDILMQVCFFETITMVYDNVTNSMIDKPGVFTRISGDYGSIESIEYLNPTFQSLTSYFHPLINLLETEFNYKNMVDMFSLSYDFRDIADPRKSEEYFEMAQIFIENLRNKTGMPVIIVSHSLGGVLMAHFFNRLSREWKDNNINLWYSISSPFSGLASAILVSITGEINGVSKYLMFPDYVRQSVTSFPTIYFLYPSPPAFNKNFVIVETPNINYTIGNISKQISETYNSEVSNICSLLPNIFIQNSPDVNMVCAYGIHVNTPSKIYMEKDLKSNHHKIEYSDGDGTVDHESLSSCKYWIKENSKPLEILEIENGEHHDLMKSEGLVSHFTRHIHNRNKFKLVIK
ncbi:hypothetical protein HZS_7562 [Henneguya salminicola]|nr:hypothetical protein HZS_7562 [Henneguya salminicola]